MDYGQKPGKILDVVKGKRTVDEIESSRRKLEVLQIRLGVANTFTGRFSLGAYQHILGDVQTQHVRCTVFSRPTAKPAKAAAKIDDIKSVQIGQQRPHRRPFRRAR